MQSIAKARGRWPWELDQATPDQFAELVGYERALRDIAKREADIARNRQAAGVPQ